jgi:hypothetical protein
MKRIFKPLITAVLVIISIIVIAKIGFIYQTEFKLTDIISYTSSDKLYKVSFQMVGEPEWPFGPSTARVKVINKANNKTIKDFTVKVHDDGGVLQDINCHVKWSDSSVIITLTGSEQDDDVYIVSLI